MGSSKIRDILTSFRPDLDLFAISTGDGRIEKKRKLGTSLLVFGKGKGDVLALDVAAGQLKWSHSDCHQFTISWSLRNLERRVFFLYFGFSFFPYVWIIFRYVEDHNLAKTNFVLHLFFGASGQNPLVVVYL